MQVNLNVNILDAAFVCFILLVAIAAIVNYWNKSNCRKLMGLISVDTLHEYFGGKETRGVYLTYLGLVDDGILHISVDRPEGKKSLFLKREGVENIDKIELVIDEIYYLNNENVIVRAIRTNS
jgi:hypothetical protein